jgi:uncharacterized protein
VVEFVVAVFQSLQTTGRLIILVLIAFAMNDAALAGSTEGYAAYKHGDYAVAMREFRPLAERGDASAQVAVGWLYDNALGVPHDDAEAVKWYLRAAAQGNALAQQYLGTMYGEGQGVPRDFVEAEKWFRLAAQQGNAGGQYGLGIMYRDGVVVARDPIEAYKWFSLAIISGAGTGIDQNASAVRAELSKQMNSEQVRKADELAKAWKPAHA